ncbi:hypothetical protein Goshw_012631, partial [Gossypium schwendimanii]|nr:hypothetical protein [Gossypium schwendimanii]
MAGAVKIPPKFFKQTEGLKVLDLFGMRFPSLPESIIHLTDLRMLCLKECAVDDITILGELKNLEILDLSKSGIKELPMEMAQLTQLRLLDLSWCTELEIIPPNVLSSLSKLEELYMGGSFVEWEKEGVVETERKNASLDELNKLPCLSTLYVHILDAQMIPKHQFVETLDKYNICVGDYNRFVWVQNHECSRTLKLKLCTNIYLENGLKMLLIKTEDLRLEGLEGIKNVLVELNNGKDLPHLKRLHVKNECGKLEHLLSPSLARSLVQLQCFRIEDCKCLRDIILIEEIEEERKDVICFPRLNSLCIDGLPNLIFFSSGNHKIEFPLLEELWIERCPNFIEFISQSSNESGMHALFSEK